MEKYFYTCNARVDKIYVFRNGWYINQLIEFGGKYFWISLNQCDCNWDDFEGGYPTIQKAIEDIIQDGDYTVYQLDTLKELAEFIESEEE